MVSFWGACCPLLSYSAATPAPKESDDELSVLHVDGMTMRILRTGTSRNARPTDGWKSGQAIEISREVSGQLWSTKVVQHIVATSQTFQMWSPFNKHCPPQPFPLVLQISEPLLYEQIIPAGRRGRLTFRPRPRCRSRLKRPFTANRFLIAREAFVSVRHQG